MTVQKASASEQQAPGDSGMPDAMGADQVEEISRVGNFALFMAQVCHFFLKSKTILFPKT